MKEIKQLIKAYKEADPPTKRQASLPLVVFDHLLAQTDSSVGEAVGQLAGGALFFAMRSCEYSTTGERNPKTKRLRLRNITFYDEGGKRITTRLAMAKTVKVTFKNQKNGEKMESIVRTRKKEFTELDPVVLWARVVTRIQKMEGTGPNTFVNTVCENGRLYEITAAMVRSHIKAAVQVLNDRGNDTRVSPHEVGTHSIRSSFATLLANRGVNEKKIMLHGRWKSDTFMKYIRKDVVNLDITTKISTLKNHNVKRLV